MCQLFIVLHSSVQGKSIEYKVGLLIKRLTKKRSEFSTGLVLKKELGLGKQMLQRKVSAAYFVETGNLTELK